MKVLKRHFLGDNTSYTYPHCNGFLPGGDALIYRQDLEPNRSVLYRLNLKTLESCALPEIPSLDPTRSSGLAWDVALENSCIGAISHRTAWVLDHVDAKEWRKVYSSPEGVKHQDLPSLTPDGRRFLTGENRADGTYAAVEINLVTNEAKTLFTKPWFANHFHYSPHDPSWIGFAHEGRCEVTLDRCWAWHAEKAPEGRCVMDQCAVADDPRLPLNVGHERWCFHDASAYVIAYAMSPGGKRGLWEVFADGRPPRLLRESNTAWHCNMDATGRIAVVDTSAAWDSVPVVGEEFYRGRAAHLHADAERLSYLSDVVLLDLRTGQDLHVARVTRTRHPYHPHPALSLDGRWLVYNDITPGRTGAWLVELDLR